MVAPPAQETWQTKLQAEKQKREWRGEHPAEKTSEQRAGRRRQTHGVIQREANFV